MTPELITAWALALMTASISVIITLLFFALCIGIVMTVLKG